MGQKGGEMTKREAEAYSFIIGFAEKNGYLPTMRDVMEGLGICSTSTAKRYFDGLQRKGYISRADGKGGYAVKGLRYVYEGGKIEV